MKTPPTTYQLAIIAATLCDTTRVFDPEFRVLHALRLWSEAERQCAIEADFAAKTNLPAGTQTRGD